jgi:NUMOD3 motif
LEEDMTKVLTADHKRKIGDANRGRKLTPEHKAKIGAASRGRTHTAEAKKKIGDALRGKTSPARQAALARTRALAAVANRGPWSEERKARYRLLAAHAREARRAAAH